MIPVTKPFLPNREKLDKYIDGIYEREWLTNNGPLVQELTKRLEEYLGVENLLLVSNGTLALQIAYRALGIHESKSAKVAEAITTPFTFVATASSLKWEGIEPIFADIDPETWCLNPQGIEQKITEQTVAIVPVHVYGNACDVEAIEALARRQNLKVIYDAAHAFGVKYKGESILRWGDAATLSFHATKVFHSIEGGAIVFKHREDMERAKRLMSFGMTGPETISDVGINAKMNEFQAAMGLCVLDEIDENIKARERHWYRYQNELTSSAILQRLNNVSDYNFAYFPVLFRSKEELLHVSSGLADKGIIARRYFYPSLNELEIFGADLTLPISSGIAERILCLPIYAGLDANDVNSIIDIVKRLTSTYKEMQ
ncbi:DegT/DnrJ/EryC1/StrS family aminotransferase [Pseudidiomarina andamanensis]|uniref:DegT/DnrJ/EryC1/StrS family aminotransferase n=1 Tax=Pseudidiomarina andamanensis TaxID=1940690 RepID=A0AA92IN28_9GAMM|nr:DegT/DnrJ/EryC1/StrS family aminotransferase [Pseudidiomarina andamanensis]MDS0217746.1 DegT/DnrJ/EryC1/StrS family aminotransferase [Pseudidiomarina andamanensis]QGT96734.1 DegT/DnrJ/EryC1/StrS family aminotransferase [Pseudidiomarina andamanensis]